MPKIFISYRREDSAYPAQQIFRELCNSFGPDSVVFDIDSIPLGIDFRKYINDQVSKCDVLLAVIGDRWEEILNQKADAPNDYVRIEIQAALERDIPVVPVLLDKATIPAEKNLPSELAPLAYRNAAEVRAGKDFDVHLSRLVSGLELLILGIKPDTAEPTVEKKDPKTTQRKITNNLGMTFVYIPPGTFTMGMPEDEPDRRNDEQQHQVTLTQGFYLQNTQVTQGQWRPVMGMNPSRFKGDGNRPVESVSWDDVQIFVGELNKREGRSVFSLPTEAQWEYACRAGTQTRYYSGDTEHDLDRVGWYGKNSGRQTHPVGEKEPNAFGLYDMHGNVYEWCQDWWGDYPSGAVTDPTGPLLGSSRVMRGGYWNGGVGYCRSALRSWIEPGYRDSRLGFRLALSPGQQGEPSQ